MLPLLTMILEYKGTFACNDERLNEIWQTAAYTVHVNMQDYLWDGIKRDRLVWIGDMHPEVSTVANVFGAHECVNKSLDLIRDKTPLPNVMNGLPAYTLWWILIQHDWFLFTGDLAYLRTQHAYIREAVSYFAGLVDENGEAQVGNNFLDWPSSTNPEGQKAGVQALMAITMQAASNVMTYLGDEEAASFASSCAAKVKSCVCDPNALKQAIALQVLAGQADPAVAAESLTENGVHGYSTFLGYYILKALGAADRTTDALDAIRTYWGAMLDLGATSFWEDFDIAWTENCSRIDELLEENDTRNDIHGDFGGYCYKGYRHSLCHGWASGPASFLIEHVLGIRPLEPGCKKIQIRANLGDLTWASGSFPTPYGTVTVSHKKKEDGSVETTYTAPDGVEVVL